MNNIKILAKIISDIKTDVEALQLLQELLTQSELDTLSKRWRILNLLNQGKTQRDVAAQLQVSLCKVTRGAKILKQPQAIVKKYLDGEKNEQDNFQKDAEQRGFLRKFRRAIYK